VTVAELTDAQLVLRARRGDREAFSSLAQRAGSTLVGILRRVLGDDEAARDAAQEALLRAWLRLDTLREPDQFRPWLHRIAVNLCRDRLRRAAKFPQVGLEAVDLDRGGDGHPDSPHAFAERRDAAVAVRRALLRLPLEQRTAIVLREYEGYTSREIGELTDVPAATVRSRIFHGLRAMRAMLPDHGPGASPGPGGDV
jgi:RNA polymerase sigma-70 factor (ECF subfamily)